MFLSKRIKVKINPDILKSGSIPLLVRDQNWKTMTQNNQTRNMKKVMSEMEMLLKTLQETEKNIEKQKERKKSLTQEILALSYSVNEDMIDEKHLKSLESKREALKSASLQLEQSYKTLELIPQKMNRLNHALLEETARVIFEELIKTDRHHQQLDQEIRKLREKLDQLRIEKEKAMVEMERQYGYLHHLLGPGEMEKLDEEIAFQPINTPKNRVE